MWGEARGSGTTDGPPLKQVRSSLLRRKKTQLWWGDGGVGLKEAEWKGSRGPLLSEMSLWAESLYFGQLIWFSIKKHRQPWQNPEARGLVPY